MPVIGKGVEEIRVSEPSGAYRVIYVARRAEAVYVLHAFQKKTQATRRRTRNGKTTIGELRKGAGYENKPESTQAFGMRLRIHRNRLQT